MAASSKDAPLYGQARPAKKRTSHEISASGSLAFASQLSSLISTSSSKTAKLPGSGSGSGRTGKEDIFTTHNRNAHRRAAKDEQNGTGSLEPQKHTTRSQGVDVAAWHRSKRKMEEKARLYAAMKRGHVQDEDGKHMVDFDRKWAEKADRQGHSTSDGSDDDGSSEGEEAETVEWTDEFGRTRRGTPAQMAREQRQQQLGADNESRARPAAPERLIYGDTVQDDAFRPDTMIMDKMAELAAKRDKSLTPPPQTHFDAAKEIRSKGIGFMHFSKDEAERRKQIDALERERAETKRLRDQREKQIRDRKEQVERRRQDIRDKRSKRKVDDFLDDLEAELDAKH